MRSVERKYHLLFIGMFLVMLICMLLFSFLQIYALNQSETDNAVIILDEEALKQGAQTGIILTDITEITTTGEIRQELIQDLQHVLLFCFFAFFIISGSVFTLSGWLHKKWYKKAIEAAFLEVYEDKEDGIRNISASEKERIYSALEEHFENRFDNYKRLSAYLSHEQKNALALLRAKLEYDNHSEYLKYVDNLTSHIDDILTLSDHSIGMDLQPVDCVLLAAELGDEYRQLGSELNFDFDEDQICTIMAKKRWIARAVSNLIENAVKYGLGEPISLYVKRQYDSVIIIVSDQGVGIPEDKLPYIFANRYRIPLPNKDGYGIGLSLVSHVCDLCGGFAWVESSLKNGTCFYLSFPAYDEP